MELSPDSVYSADNLVQIAERLPRWHRVAFAALCAERLIPNYEAFAAMERWGNPSFLRTALEGVWSCIEQRVVHEHTINDHLETILEVMPDSEDYSTLFTGPAQEAVIALHAALTCCLSGDAENVSRAGMASYNTIYEYLHIVTDPLVIAHQADTQVDEWVDASPMLLAEVRRQYADLANLESRSDLSPDDLRSLREDAQQAGIQPFARGLTRGDARPR